MTVVPLREPKNGPDMPAWFRCWLAVMRLLWWGFIIAAVWRLGDSVLTRR